MWTQKAIEYGNGITVLDDGSLYIPPGQSIYIERWPLKERTVRMANVQGLHAVGEKFWGLIETIKQGIQDGQEDTMQDMIGNAVALQELIFAVIAVKDDLDTKPELAASALNISAGLTDAIAETLRAVPPPVV